MSESPSGRAAGPRRPGFFVGRPFGIPVYLAPSWFVISAVLTVLLEPGVRERVPRLSPGSAYAVSAAFVLLLYASVLLHEMAHSLVAKALRLPVRRINIYLLGGVSELEREPETAGREYLVAVAGPLLSLLLAGVALAGRSALAADSVPRLIVEELAFANGLVAVFNLLPGLPLDGGRVLRAVVWRVTGRPLTGTIAAAWGGLVLAGVVALAPFAVAGWYNRYPDPVTIIWFATIAAFLFTSASQTLNVAKLRGRVPGLSVRRLVRLALTVPADLPLAEALRRAQSAGARGLVVVDGAGRPDAVVSEAAVVATPEQRRPWVAVGTLARRLDAAMILPIDLAGQAVLDALQQAPASEYVVVDEAGAVVGVLATADVAQAVTSR